MIFFYVLAVIEVQFLAEQYIWLFCCIHICTLNETMLVLLKLLLMTGTWSSVEGIMCSLENRSLSSLQSQLAWRLEFKTLNGKGGKMPELGNTELLWLYFLFTTSWDSIFFRSRMPYFRPERLFHLLKNGHEFTNICGSTLILPHDSVDPFKV